VTTDQSAETQETRQQNPGVIDEQSYFYENCVYKSEALEPSLQVEIDSNNNPSI
jgi:hypothetical protein